MIRHVVNRDVQVFEPLVRFLEVIQAVHHPGHVIQAHLPLLLQESVVTHLYQRHLM
jgi:hypothetical protein